MVTIIFGRGNLKCKLPLTIFTNLLSISLKFKSPTLNMIKRLKNSLYIINFYAIFASNSPYKGI